MLELEATTKVQKNLDSVLDQLKHGYKIESVRDGKYGVENVQYSNGSKKQVFIEKGSDDPVIIQGTPGKTITRNKDQRNVFIIENYSSPGKRQDSNSRGQRLHEVMDSIDTTKKQIDEIQGILKDWENYKKKDEAYEVVVETVEAPKAPEAPRAKVPEDPKVEIKAKLEAFKENEKPHPLMVELRDLLKSKIANIKKKMEGRKKPKEGTKAREKYEATQEKQASSRKEMEEFLKNYLNDTIVENTKSDPGHAITILRKLFGPDLDGKTADIPWTVIGKKERNDLISIVRRKKIAEYRTLTDELKKEPAAPEPAPAAPKAKEEPTPQRTKTRRRLKKNKSAFNKELKTKQKQLLSLQKILEDEGLFGLFEPELKTQIKTAVAEDALHPFFLNKKIQSDVVKSAHITNPFSDIHGHDYRMLVHFLHEAISTGYTSFAWKDLKLGDALISELRRGGHKISVTGSTISKKKGLYYFAHLGTFEQPILRNLTHRIRNISEAERFGTIYDGNVSTALRTIETLRTKKDFRATTKEQRDSLNVLKWSLFSGEREGFLFGKTEYSPIELKRSGFLTTDSYRENFGGLSLAELKDLHQQSLRWLNRTRKEVRMSADAIERFETSLFEIERKIVEMATSTTREKGQFLCRCF